MTKKKPGSKIGRPISHGAYSLIAQGEILKQHPFLRRYLRAVHLGLVNDLGGPARLTTAQNLLIDGVIAKLAVIKSCEIYLGKTGIIDGAVLRRERVLALQPVLKESYLAFQNSMQRALDLLGIKLSDIETPLVLKLLEEENKVVDVEEGYPDQGNPGGNGESQEPGEGEGGEI